MKINTDPKKIEEALTRRVEQVLPDKARLKRLMRQRQIKLYLGIDPTGSQLHLGHAIPLRKIQEFADLGHEAILVFGTGTVLAGDPSQREAARPRISPKEIEENIKNWKEQANKIIDFSKVKIKYNGDWLLKLGLKEIIDIASNISAIKLFQRDMFQERIRKKETVWMHETLYPLLQGYDSVFLDIDLEVGGTDQVFNMLIGRELEQKMKGKEKFVLTCPMLLGIDGKTMSKTSGNCVWISESPDQMFGKLMSMPDSLIIPYFELVTDTPEKTIKKYREDLKAKKVNPRDLKAKLAFEIVRMYHSLRAAQKAEKEFNKVFRQKELPRDIPGIKIKEKSLLLVDLLLKAKLVSSKAEARRLVQQKGVKINGRSQDNWQKRIGIERGMIVQVGKRRFAKIR